MSGVYMKILVAGYGFVAECIIHSLLDKHGVCVRDILCFTYSEDENSSLIHFLNEKGISYSTKNLMEQSSQEQIREFSPDYIASLYYRNIIPGSILSLARITSFNIHPSLLPNSRGCFSAPWAIINGEAETGITFHEMVEKVDKGQILWQKAISITAQDTGYSLYHRLCAEAIRQFNPFFKELTQGNILPREMPLGGTFFKRELPHQGHIDPSWDEIRIDAFIRAMFFPPFKGAILRFFDKEIEVSTFDEYLALREARGERK
jgi:methionyl-tRNA formyltransferase